MSGIPDHIHAEDVSTLIIGLGGLGADAVLQMKAQFSGKNGAAPEERPHRIAYLAVDMDANITRTEYCDNSRFQPGETLILSTPDRLTQPYMPMQPYIREWWDNQVSSPAFGVRQAGRLALFANADHVAEKLKSVLHDLLLQSPHAPARITVVGSLCGSTGSGMLLDMAQLIHYVMRTDFPSFDYSVDACCMLPDVLSNRICSSFTMSIMEANACAALMEIDRFMGAQRPEHTQQYSRQIHVQWVKPFDHVFLISECCPDGDAPNGEHADHDILFRRSAEQTLSEILHTKENASLTSTKGAEVSTQQPPNAVSRRSAQEENGVSMLCGMPLTAHACLNKLYRSYSRLSGSMPGLHLMQLRDETGAAVSWPQLIRA